MTRLSLSSPPFLDLDRAKKQPDSERQAALAAPVPVEVAVAPGEKTAGQAEHDAEVQKIISSSRSGCV